MSQLLSVRTSMEILIAKRLVNLLEKQLTRTDVLKLKLKKFK